MDTEEKFREVHSHGVNWKEIGALSLIVGTASYKAGVPGFLVSMYLVVGHKLGLKMGYTLREPGHYAITFFWMPLIAVDALTGGKSD